MITGGDRFLPSVDDVTDVLLRVVEEVDDLEAETVEFVDVVFDEPLAPELFVSLS